MVTLIKDEVSGLEKVLLTQPCGASAEIYLLGGHVTSWKNDFGDELLFLSSKATFKPPKPIRGGIPICFPQFSTDGKLEKHGFARNHLWTVEAEAPPIFCNNGGNPTPCGNSASSVDLILRDAQDTNKLWTYRFELRMRVVLKRGGNLSLTLRVRNIDCKAFTFTVAFGAYFVVSDIHEVRIEGLETFHFLDNLQDRARFTEQDSITFEGEVDRVYVDTPNTISIIDHDTKRIILVRKDGLPDTVVWNPWDKVKTLPDFAADDYLHMVCVQPAAVQDPITLKPGEEWTGRQELVSGHWSATGSL